MGKKGLHAEDVIVYSGLKSSVLIVNSQMLVFGITMMAFAVMLHILTSTLDVFTC